MSLCSMTGFGQAESSTPMGNCRVEIRSVNGRYLDIQYRIPRSFANLESKIKKLMSEQVSRGSVIVSLVLEHDDSDMGITWDDDKVGAYVKILREIQKKYKLAGEPSLSDLLSLDKFLKTDFKKYEEKTLWKHTLPIIKNAIKDFQQSRENEAKLITVDLKKIVTNLTKTLKQIEKRAPVRLNAHKKNLKSRVESLINDTVDPQRIATELAFMADKLDISEECTRLRAHIEKFENALSPKEPVGKRMNFILQEMNREANTIASKANDTTIAHLSVSLRESIEKIREQIQNIE